jgi:hypothetical protein
MMEKFRMPLILLALSGSVGCSGIGARKREIKGAGFYRMGARARGRLSARAQQAPQFVAIQYVLTNLHAIPQQYGYVEAVPARQIRITVDVHKLAVRQAHVTRETRQLLRKFLAQPALGAGQQQQARAATQTGRPRQ